MSKRIKIVLPDATLAVPDRVTPKGARRKLIDRAVRHLAQSESNANLRERLKVEAMENAARDLALAAEWVPLEEEAASPFQPGLKSASLYALTTGHCQPLDD